MPLTSAATFSAFSWLWSSTPIFAPLAAMARAVAAPRPEPPPVMITATSFNCMLATFPWAFLLWTRTFLFSGRGILLVGRIEHAAADQIFHVPDVLPADLLRDRTDT